MKKIFTMAVALGMFTVGQAEELTTFVPGLGQVGVEEPPLIGLGISPSGRYVAGSLDMGAGLWVGDAETGVVKYQLCLDEEGYVTDEGGELRGVDNNGVGIGFTWTGLTYDIEGKSAFLPLPDDAKSSLGEDITASGSMMVGSVMVPSGTLAGYWENDEWHYLPFPTDEEMAAVRVRRNSAAKMVSCDGRVIYGNLGSFTIPCAWIRNAQGEYEADYWPLRFLKLTAEDDNDPAKPLFSISAMYGMSMSDNGRYLLALGLVNDSEGVSMNCPIVYDTELKTLKVYNEHQAIDPMGEGLWPTVICNDGSIIGTVGQPVFRSSGCFFLKADAKEAQLFRDIFPEFNKVYGEGDGYGFTVPTGMSADGNKILAYTYYADDYNDESSPAYYETFIIENKFCQPSGVEEITAAEEVNAVPVAYYDINGRRVNNLQKGLNIVRMSDGSSRKVMK